MSSSCITPQEVPENAGGWTALGKQERLLITLEHSGNRYRVGGDNVTVL